MKPSTRCPFAALGLLLVWGGCVMPEPPRPGHLALPFVRSFEPPAQPPLPSSDDEKYLAQPFVINFDDHGEIWDADTPPPGILSLQLDAALTGIRHAKRFGQPLNLIVYIHGWKHNASDQRNPGNPDAEGDLPKFTDFIATLNQAQIGAGPTRRRYVGVYLAWRGASWPMLRDAGPTDLLPPVNDYLIATWTFWNRLAAANRVAGTTMTYTLQTLAREAKSPRPGTSGYSPSDAKVVFIGHSMGGRILEHALAQSIAGSLGQRAPEIADGLRDLAVKAVELPKRIADLQTEETSASNALTAAQTTQQTALSEVTSRQTAVDTARRNLTATETRLRDKTAELEQAEKETEGFLKSFLALVGITPPATTTEAPPTPAALLEEARNQAEKSVTASNPVEATRLAEKQREKVAGLIRQAQAAAISQPTDLPAKIERLRRELEEARQDNATARTAESAAATALALAKDARTTADSAVATVSTKLAFLRKSIAQVATELAELPIRQASLLARPADLILLLNPAVDSIGARQLQATLEAARRTALASTTPTPEIMSAFNRPWIIAVSSQADGATKNIYRTGGLLGGLFQRFRTDYDQWKAFRTTPPQNDALLTHDITPALPLEGTAAPAAPAAPIGETSAQRALRLKTERLEIVTRNDQLDKLAEWLRARHLPHAAGDLRRTMVTEDRAYHLTARTTGAGDAKPYWIVRADKSLIQDHGDVFSTRAQGLVTALLRIANSDGATTAP